MENKNNKNISNEDITPDKSYFVQKIGTNLFIP